MTSIHEPLTTQNPDAAPVFENLDEEDKPPLEIASEISSVEEQTAAVQVDDFNMHNENNNPLVVEGNNGEEKENVAELNSTQDASAAVQVDDFNILNVNNNPAVVEGHDEEEHEDVAKFVSIQESNINESNFNDDALVVEGTTENVSVQEAYENNTTLTVKDDSKENEDDEQINDTKNEAGEEPFQLDDIKDKNIEIHVGRLDKDTVEDDLVQVFQKFGELKSTRIVKKQNTDKSKFAFIQFATADQAKRALFELKGGVEVRGKRVTVSASHSNRSLYLGNIHKTWKKEQVLEQLKHYGIEHIETFAIPEYPPFVGEDTGFVLLEFASRVTASTAFQRLQKPDVVFGCDISAKVAFAQSIDETLTHVSQVYVDGLTKDWTEEKVEESFKKYGEIVGIKLCPSTKTKQKDFGFITFTSHESALACVEGINNSAIGGERKLKANIARSQPRNQAIQGFRGGFKVENTTEVSTSNKAGEVSTKISKPKSSKMKGVLNTRQTKRYKTHSSKNKENGSSDQRLIFRDQGTSKRTKRSGGREGKNSKTAIKARKRKMASAYEAREDGGHGKKPFKKQKGNMYVRDRNNTWNPQNDTHIIRGHDGSRNSTGYVVPYTPNYVASASNAYHPASDHSSASMRYTKMEPHAGFIEPASANQSRSYTGYAQPVVQNPHSQQHQTMYFPPAPASQSQNQSQLYPGYYDHSALTQSHWGYNGTAVAPQTQPYGDYHQPAAVQIAGDPYNSGLARVAGTVAHVGGPLFPASQVPDHTSYYQGGGSYSGSYTSQ